MQSFFVCEDAVFSETKKIIGSLTCFNNFDLK